MPASIRTNTNGAVQGFLKLDGIEGESTDARHSREIDFVSCTFGAANTIILSGGGGGASAGKVKLQEVHVVKPIDKASVALFIACASGQHVRTATLTCRRVGGSALEFLVISLEDVLVTSIQDVVTNVAGEAPTHEEITLNFGKLTLRYVPQKPDGSADAPVVGGWDARTNKKV